MERLDEHSKASVPDPELRRRRLVRGAAAIVPVVLTLRSGAVVAASSACTGVKGFVDTSQQGQFSPSFTIAPGDVCVMPTSTESCPPQKISGATASSTIEPVGSSGQYRCTATGFENRQGIAILSSAAYQSLIGTA